MHYALLSAILLQYSLYTVTEPAAQCYDYGFGGDYLSYTGSDINSCYDKPLIRAYRAVHATAIFTNV